MASVSLARSSWLMATAIATATVMAELSGWRRGSARPSESAMAAVRSPWVTTAPRQCTPRLALQLPGPPEIVSARSLLEQKMLLSNRPLSPGGFRIRLDFWSFDTCRADA